MYIPFNRIHAVGREQRYIKQAMDNMHLMGDGIFTKNCHAWLEQNVSCKRALLTQSCTAALEMTALLMDLKPGDEVIMPSFTFVVHGQCVRPPIGRAGILGYSSGHTEHRRNKT